MYVLKSASFFLQAQKRELEIIRQNYRKNSLARSPQTPAIPSVATTAAATSPASSRTTTAQDHQQTGLDPPIVKLSNESGEAVNESDSEEEDDDDDDDEDDTTTEDKSSSS